MRDGEQIVGVYRLGQGGRDVSQQTLGLRRLVLDESAQVFVEGQSKLRLLRLSYGDAKGA
jgi:hypothetical protein